MKGHDEADDERNLGFGSLMRRNIDEILMRGSGCLTCGEGCCSNYWEGGRLGS